MMIAINLLLITLIVVFVIDLTDAVDTLKGLIWKLIHPSTPYTEYSLKPFDCSLCSSWWIMLLYLLLINSFTIPYIALSALFSFLTPTFSNILIAVQDEINRWIRYIFR